MQLKRIGETKMTMNGKMTMNDRDFDDNGVSFADLYKKQQKNQEKLLKTGKYYGFTDCKGSAAMQVPRDDVSLFSYHVQQLMSEIGEVLEADRRWKNFRNDKHDADAKIDEIADCFIVLMNVAMFSGVSGEQMSAAIERKISKVLERIVDE